MLIIIGDQIMDAPKRPWAWAWGLGLGGRARCTNWTKGLRSTVYRRWSSEDSGWSMEDRPPVLAA